MKDAKYVRIHKEIGETPLEALERYRTLNPMLKDVPMTYAGRLDPLASGELLILIGDECKHKEKYLNLDKEYEIEIVFGIETDAHDALGISSVSAATMDHDRIRKVLNDLMAKCPYVFDQRYPAYSSKTVDGRQLFDLARKGALPEEMPTKKVSIYSVELVSERKIGSNELLSVIKENISKVKGDFRQSKILDEWEKNLKNMRSFPVFGLKVRCSSGTYMRSLADALGKETGFGAFALSIQRTKILV